MSTTGLALDRLSLLSVFVESVLWGIFLSSYLLALYLLLQKKSRAAEFFPHILIVSVMFVLCTVHVGLSFRRVIQAFFGPLSPNIYLGDVTTGPFRFKEGIHLVEIFLSDLVIVYRSFMLWNKNYAVVILPFLLAVGTLVSGIGALQAVNSHTQSMFEGKLHLWMVATLTLALITKATCLFLDTLRVRHIHASITSHVDRHTMVYTVILVLVESGIAVFATSAILLPTYVVKNKAFFAIYDALSPIMGLTVIAILFGMLLNLSNPGNAAVPVSHPQFNRFSAPSRPIPSPRRTKNRWDDSPDNSDCQTTGPSSPVLSRTPSVRDMNKSTGTLNMAIVI